MEVIWWETLGLELLAVYAGLCHAIIVTQKERFKIIPEGSQTNITCNYDDSSYIILFWYRQDSNAGEKQFQLIGYSIAERCSDANIIQPQSMMLEEGQDARLECRQDNGHRSMLWFRQRKQHQDFQLLYNFYYGKILQKNSFLHRLNADQPIMDLCVLSISAVKPEDSAVYFCASSETTADQNTVFFLQKSSPFVFKL